MSNTELTTYKTGGALSDKSLHPGEYGRASAWIKKIKNDLVLNKDIYGHPPSTVFERPANQYVGVMTTDPGAGYAALGDQQSYIVAADGTPLLKRNIDFSPPDTAGAGNALQTPERSTNPVKSPTTSNPRCKTGIHHDSKPRLHPASNDAETQDLGTPLGSVKNPRTTSTSR
jgi:hypothetical protein